MKKQREKRENRLRKKNKKKLRQGDCKKNKEMTNIFYVHLSQYTTGNVLFLTIITGLIFRLHIPLEKFKKKKLNAREDRETKRQRDRKGP